MSSVPPSFEYDYPAVYPRGMNDYGAVLGAMAALASFEEIMLSPKPGLVCPDSSGSHSDMDWVTFLLGASALTPFWRIQAMDGLHLGYYYKPLGQIAERLRETGLEMERAMYEATGGVNTHKGLIFAMSLLLGAFGVVAGHKNIGMEALTSWDIFRTAVRMIAPRVEREIGRAHV